MNVYLVGGAVRDGLLKKPIYDKDFVVVGASASDLLSQGFSQVGADFPVFLHPNTHHEYALARTERKSGQGYKGFAISTDNVSLEDDLARRDLTINAMAIQVAGLFDDTPITGKVIDPYGGQHDLDNKLLRHVSDAFAEDPLRVLRVARFYARLFELGFGVHDDTKTLMKHIATSGELSCLSRERIWAESVKALDYPQGFAYFELLFELDILKQILPSLNDAWQDHALRQHTFLSLRQSYQYSLSVKFSLLTQAFIHKPNAQERLSDTCQQLLTPKAITQFASLFISHYDDLVHLDNICAKNLLTLIEHTKAHKDAATLFELIKAVQIATGKPINTNFIQNAIKSYQSVSIDMIDKTLTGKHIGDELTRLRLDNLSDLLSETFHA